MPAELGVAVQHRDTTVRSAAAQPDDVRPTPGPIAILPDPEGRFVDAVEAGGGTVEPLSERTRGVVWLSSSQPEVLRETLDGHPDIEWVQLPWAGVDAFAGLLADYRGRRLTFTSAKGAYSQPVAEHALALTLALLRQLPRKSRSTAWAEHEAGLSLFGMNVLVVGAGGIALEIIRLLAPFDPAITVVRRSAEPVPGAERTVTSDRLDEVLPDADVVILAAASTRETARMLGADQFAAMKSTAVLVNIARGALVDTDALAAALADGTIDGAGLDVTYPEPLPDGHPLWHEPGCIITSHSADTKAMTRPLLAARITANVEAFLGDGRFVGIVDVERGY
ncbi:MAG: dehydrogenase [Microbacteriaceae bacterium]|jgi:phosphoglycerate dehydrogenase-like enzyme|nr:dehydrogenase [Microbacteriaceae bacterium]